MAFLLIMLFIVFPTMAIYGSFKVRKLNRNIDELRNSTVSKETFEKLFEEMRRLEAEKDHIDVRRKELEKTILRYEYEKKSMLPHEQYKISVNKDLVQKTKFKPSDLDMKQLEDCMNYYIETYAAKR